MTGFVCYLFVIKLPLLQGIFWQKAFRLFDSGNYPKAYGND